MKRLLPILFLFLLAVVSCESTSSEPNPISKEHAALLGTWIEGNGAEKVIWTFKHYEVKWKGYTHVYTVSGDSVLISGMVYRLQKQSEMEMEWITPDGKTSRFTRQLKKG